jgi:hypothetical protein
MSGSASFHSVSKPRYGGWLTLDPLESFWVPQPFTTLVKGAGVEFDFDYRPPSHQSALTPSTSISL